MDVLQAFQYIRHLMRAIANYEINFYLDILLLL